MMMLAMFLPLLAAPETTETTSSFGYLELVVGGVVGLALGLALLLTRKQDPLQADPKVKELTLRVMNKLKMDAAFAPKVEALFQPAVAPKADDTPIRLLALLQREARLLDFLMEDIANAGDAQIGSAVREIHQKSQTVLKKYLKLDPVRTETEGSNITIPAGYDPSTVQLQGNLTGSGPYTGTLQHSGWKVSKVDLPKPPESADVSILQPAIVEI